MPKVIGKYNKITVLDSAEALAEFIQAAKNESYHVPINGRWRGLQSIRCTSYEQAHQQVQLYYRKLSL